MGITVRGEGKKAVAKFTGRTMGLRGSPSNWKKMLHVPLVKVLGRARSYEVVHRKLKKGKPQFTKAEIKTLWGKKCVDNEAFGRSYSMGCKRYLREHECHQHGGCMWQTGLKASKQPHDFTDQCRVDKLTNPVHMTKPAPAPVVHICTMVHVQHQPLCVPRTV